MSDLRERWQRTLAVAHAPHVQIEMFGGEEAREIFRRFTSRHPRFRVTTYKRWGVALMRVPDTYDDYLSNCSRIVRRRRSHAERSGYRYQIVSPNDYLDEIVEINRSAPTRQGHAMAEHYVNRKQVIRTFEGRASIHGILDASGVLRAYALVLDLGEAFAFSLLIGHAEALDDGVMYLLVSEVIRSCVDARQLNGTPTWLMCDTLWGASKGLAAFKERLGFRPYTVAWAWRDRN